MAQISAAWLDSMYNNRALVPEFADHLARWVRESALARTVPSCALDVAYGV